MRSRVTAGSGIVIAFALLLPAVLLGAGTLAACGSDTVTGSATTPTTAAPSASTQTTPVAVQEFHGMLPVVSVQSLIKERPYRSTKTVGDVVQVRHAVWTYRQKSSDPRLNGIYTVVINGDQRQSDMSATLWGTSVLRNQGGTWVGKWTGGIAAGGNEHHLYGTAKGTGAYAGLVSHGNGWFVEAGEGFTPDIQIVLAGWLETTDGSPVPPAPGPGSTPANWTPVVGIATMKQTGYDTGYWPFVVEMSDPRVSGPIEGLMEESGSERSDGSIDYRAKGTMTKQDGVWEGAWGSGVRGPGRVEHFQYGTSTGSGAYAGLTYYSFWHYMERRDYVAGDTFVITGWIEEAQ